MSETLVSMDSIRHGYAQINGVRLHYAECGSGDRLVVLVHGFPECWYTWRHQMVALGDRYHVVAPDMRGFNLSDKPPRVADYRTDVLVSDVIELIRHFGASEAAVVGHDLGAGISWTVAQRHPENVWKLATMQVPPIAVWRANLTLKQALSSWYMVVFQIPRLPEWLIRARNFALVERAFKNSAARPDVFTDEDIAVYKEALSQPFAVTATLNYYRANFAPLFLSRRKSADPLSEGRIRVPTLFIYGEQDPTIVPETVRNVGAYVDAPYRELRIKDSGHWVQNEAIAEVNSALRSFLDEP
jgi:pimeloyl-ACP methyl ester carboxylesterase